MDMMQQCIEAFRAVEPHAIINRAALRLAINATIEACAQVAEEGTDGGDGEWDSSARSAANAIRELKI